MDNQYTNPYTSTYVPSGFDQQNAQGINPVFQNTSAQQQYLANELRQQNQFMQPHAQKGAGGGMGGLSPMSMANMLKSKPSASGISNPNSFGGSASNNLSAYAPWNQSSTANTYGTDPYSQQSIMLAQQDAGLSDAPWSGAGDWIGSGLGDLFGGIGDWFGGLFGGGGALAGAGETAAEVAPAAAAAL
jgi:hypothetical protein